MTKILIDHNPKKQLTRTACVVNGKLTELFIDHDKKSSVAGHIFKGTVQNVLPSGFAFIDIGQPKNGFLNLPADFELKQGEKITVQVRKDATGEKGANLSTDLQFKGSLAILTPGKAAEAGVSQKIKDPAIRKKLKKTALKLLPDGYSVLLRTNAAAATEEELAQEFARLAGLAESVATRAKYATSPSLLHKSSTLLTDLLNDNVDEIIVSSQEAFAKLKEELPEPYVQKLQFWVPEKRSLFERFDIEKQITKALHRKLWLPCGGFVTFDQVEACMVIDVNTGKFGGKGSYAKTILRANLEAAAVIAEQIALRNLSGMIIVDFIDIPEEEDKQKLLAAFSKELAKDRIRPEIVGMTQLGLVQLTRQKRREPLSRLLQQDCPHCKGSGLVTM